MQQKTPSVIGERLGVRVNRTMVSLDLFLVQPKHAQIRQQRLQIGLALGFGLETSRAVLWTKNRTGRHWALFYYARKICQSFSITHLDKKLSKMITHPGSSNFVQALYDLKNLSAFKFEILGWVNR